MKGLALAKTTNKKETAITEEAMRFLCELSEGYPHFIQQFAYSAFAADSDDTIDMEDVLAGAFNDNGALAQLGSKYFNEMYYGRINSPEYRKVLNTMAEYADKWVARKTLVQASGVKENDAEQCSVCRKAKNVILANEAQPGQYRLPTSKSFMQKLGSTPLNRSPRSETRDVGTLFDEVVPNGDPAVH